MKTLLIILCLISQAIRAQNDSNAYQNHLQKLHQKGDFNGTAIVIKNSNIIYSGAFGPADKDSIKRLDVNSVFRICSVSKQFTAMGILILKEKGKLKITDSHIEELLNNFDTSITKPGHFQKLDNKDKQIG